MHISPAEATRKLQWSKLLSGPAKELPVLFFFTVAWFNLRRLSCRDPVRKCRFCATLQKWHAHSHLPWPIFVNQFVNSRRNVWRFDSLFPEKKVAPTAWWQRPAELLGRHTRQINATTSHFKSKTFKENVKNFWVVAVGRVTRKSQFWKPGP